MTEPERDSGVAAVEMALMLMLLFSLVAVALPLGIAVMHRVELDQIGFQTLRFATAAPNFPEQGSSCRRPNQAEVQQEAANALQAAGFHSLDPATVATVSPSGGTGPCSTNIPGTPVTVTVTAPLSLGVVGDLLHIVGLSVPPTMTSTALGREE